MKRRSALSVGTNGRYREEDVIPSGTEGGVEESVGKKGWVGGNSKLKTKNSKLVCGWVGGNSKFKIENSKLIRGKVAGN